MFKYPFMPRFQMPQGPWQLKEAASCIPVVDAKGAVVLRVKLAHNDFAVAKVASKLPELVETAMWAEAALGYLATKATSATDRAEFRSRFEAVNRLLNEMRT